MPQIPCWIAVWSLWALQKWLNWNLIFFHLSHYGQIESPAAVLWRGPQSRPLFRLQFDSFWKMSHFVVVMHCQALEPYMLWHRHQLWSFADLRFSPGHHPWHNLSPGVSVTLWSWRAWCVAVVWTSSHPQETLLLVKVDALMMYSRLGRDNLEFRCIWSIELCQLHDVIKK